MRSISALGTNKRLPIRIVRINPSFAALMNVSTLAPKLRATSRSGSARR
jgi:hypothetical protein